MAQRAVVAPVAAWHYVDEFRRHAVAAAWVDGEVVVREWAQGASAQRAFPAREPWEARLALWSLEARLALMGAYWRRPAGGARWSRMSPPRGAPVPDLRPSEVVEQPVLHHYHDPKGHLDELVAGLAVGDRFAVVRADLELASLDVGRIRLLQGGLPSALMVSALVHEQVARANEPWRKLVTASDYELALGRGGARRVAEAVGDLVARVSEEKWDPPGPSVVEDDVYGEFLVMLDDPRLHALHARFVGVSEEERLMEEGAPAIRRFLAARRAATPHHEQHLLTLLEASLLARERLRSGQLTRWDPEVRALTRLAYYL